MPILSSPACPVCALPTTDGERCGRCLRQPPAFDGTAAIFAYAFPVDRMVQALKYRHRLAVSSYFSQLLAAHVGTTRFDLVVPMPLHPKRLRERGFNQAVEISRLLARRMEIPVSLDLVIRSADAPPQASLPWAARKANVRGAFAVRGDLEGHSILVVDDVMTTGASLDALAQVLKRHGAVRVENLVVARTLPGH